MPKPNSTLFHDALIDLTENTIGKWFVIGELPRDPLYPYRRRWLCRCSCERSKPVSQSSLMRGVSLSCGCERTRLAAQRQFKHGMSGTRIWIRWRGMLQRCYNPKIDSYPNYGGRGITVCERWHDFSLFLSDMGLPPFPHASLERVDNNGNYSPENVRWASPKEQGQNTRQTRFLTIGGETKSVSQWGEPKGLTSSRIRLRIDRSGWTEAQAVGLEPPPKQPGPDTRNRLRDTTGRFKEHGRPSP